ncbi:hypothetical protein KFU94_57860 [Chloroflexi bacterium TSY]|nr:hypothetical protein [Chloroflexi bacterium TSY]
MPRIHLEPGLLRGFRVVICYFIAFWALQPPFFEWRSGQTSAVSVELRLLLIGLISLGLVMLSVSAFQKRLGRFFLPAIIGICTFPFLVERLWFINLARGPDVSEFILVHMWKVRQDMILLLLIVA